MAMLDDGNAARDCEVNSRLLCPADVGSHLLDSMLGQQKRKSGNQCRLFCFFVAIMLFCVRVVVL